MKIITYNMHHDKKSSDNWATILEQEDPDILLAQESLDPNQVPLPLLDSRWPNRTVWSSVTVGWGSAVYLKSRKPNEIELPEFHGWVVVMEIPGGESLLLNGRPTRFFSIHAPTGQGSYASVVNAILDMLRDYCEDADMLIGGDFNLTISKRHRSEDRQTPRCDLQSKSGFERRSG